MAFNIGINVLETDGNATPALEGAPTSVAGLLVRTGRGPTDRAVRVSSFPQFVGAFGGYDPDFLGAFGVDGFFRNGGREAYIARILGAGSATASVTLKGRGGANSLRVTAGSRGAAEAGGWGNGLFVDVFDQPEFSTRLVASRAGNQPARLQGAALTGPLDLTPTATIPARSLTLEIDGSGTGVKVPLDATTLPAPGAATAVDVAAAINARLGARVLASAAAGGVLIVSRSKGVASAVRVLTTGAGVDAETRKALGFPDTNLAAAGAAAGATPVYTEVQVTSLVGFRTGDVVRLDDGLTQTSVTITGLDRRVNGAQFFVLFAAPASVDRQEYRVEDKATLSTCEFALVVRQLTPALDKPAVVETWEKLSLDPARPNFAPTRLNDPSAGSGFVVLAALAAGGFDGGSVPTVAGVRLGTSDASNTGLTLVAGGDGTTPLAADYTGALARFDTVAIQLLAVLEDLDDGLLKAVTRAGLDYCAGDDKGDCMWVGHTPRNVDREAAKAFGQEFRAAKVYGALYWPWVIVADPVGPGPSPVRTVPPTGAVLGTYARTEQTRGIAKAPAGNEAALRGTLAVERGLTDRDHTDLVKNGSVNGIRRLPGAGIVIDASRTLSTDTRWLYVNVRLLFNFVKASLRDGLRWVKQEPNREALWRKVKFNAVTPFLLRLHAQGAFGPTLPADAFLVICGPENNPPAEVTLGNLRVEVYFNPSRPAETIVIVVGQYDAGASASER